jgi:secondary thiamine-phosphate synthase enzyme
MIQQILLTLPSHSKGFHLITDRIIKALPKIPEQGLVNVFIQHTSAGLAINENADPTVREDLDHSFDELAPENQSYYKHLDEGADDMPAHIKSVLVGSSVTIPITQGSFNLGTWQGIYLCEFRRDASPRKLVLTLFS